MIFVDNIHPLQLVLEERTCPPKDCCCNSSSLFLILLTVDSQNCLFHLIFAATFYVLEGCFQIISLAPISLFKIRQTHFFQACRLILKFSFLSSGYSLIDPHLARRVVSCRKLISPEEKITAWTQHSHLPSSE